MVGADIVTAEFGSDPAACTLVNRHVPSVAVPLDSSTGGDAIFPEPDAPCAGETWRLSACAVDAAAGTVTMEVDRPLAAANAAQDRPVVAGRNVLMYAYGDGFGYHGGRRHGTEVDLTKSGGQAVATGGLAASGQLPADATASQLLTVPPYTISAERTDYACFSFEVELGAGPGGGRQIVAAEAVIDAASEAGKLVHHFVLLSCERDGGWADFAAGKSCLAEMPQCRDVVYGWAAGATPLIMPPEAGFPVSEVERFYILQVHYDNPDGLTGVVDRNSSVRLHFTDEPRAQEAGTINIGDPNVARFGQPVASDRNYTVACPGECTSQLAGPLTIYNSVLHAHRTALYLFTNQYRNGTFLRTLEGSAFWSNDHQRNTLFERADLLPGDRLEVTGSYDTAKIDAAGEEPPVTWGLGTPQEMLMSFLFVYPRPLRAEAASPNDTISYCGLVVVDEEGTPGTMCTNGQNLTPGVGVLPVNPLSDNGPVGWSPAFGGAPTCAPTAPALHTLTVSAGHLLPIAAGGGCGGGDGAPLPAGAITPGVHALVAADGTARPVTAVSTVTRAGLYHPHTVAGNLVIDGAVVATDRTTAVPPAVAAAGLAAARAAAAVGLGGVLSRALAGGCPPPLRAVLPLLRAFSR
ncbi:hypothetical protein I4F81_006700 [Pyropia yezoensis]|uniref:Uncharacterized protein n=1 Tax=Pyropia yezoensis TaxID=2788 RepID=A0ACC3C1T0_PYRYE|nr:hypothetical protein I4F81_006700 [Neopyropia yezoensis]